MSTITTPAAGGPPAATGVAPHWRDLRARDDARSRRLLARSGLLDCDDLAWHEVGRHRLDPAELHCLVYMRDVEGFTDRDFSGFTDHPSTRTDPLIDEFLGVWRAEEAAHADALTRYLDHYAAHRDVPVPPRAPTPPPVATGTERIAVALSRPVGQVVTTVHMTWGFTNELLTMTGYRALARRTADPVLTTLLDRIAAQEARHYSFYRLQAGWRLARSALARKVVRALMVRTWTPVGVGDDFKAPEEFDRVLGTLLDGPGADGVVRRMDATVHALPGLGDVGLFQRARDRSLARLGGDLSSGSRPERPRRRPRRRR